MSLRRVRDSRGCSLLICFVVLSFFVVSCASKTVIKSRPEGAEVYIDNVRKGVTPLPYSDTAIAGSSKRLVLKKDGYKDFDTVLRKSEFRVGPCIGGVLVLFPFVWILGYPDEHEFALEKADDDKQSMWYFFSPDFSS